MLRKGKNERKMKSTRTTEEPIYFLRVFATNSSSFHLLSIYAVHVYLYLVFCWEEENKNDRVFKSSGGGAGDA